MGSGPKLKRPCQRCEDMFRPTGKFQRLCEKCRGVDNKSKLKAQYKEQKILLDEVKDSTILKKWKILSEAYKIGKKVWGPHFTRQRLAFDMDIPMTTVLRCLSLDRESKKSWRLVDEGKISVFKLAMICQLKDRTFHDEIVAMVIKDNLSTYKIKDLKIDNLSDINKERHRLAIEKGYSRKSSAYYNFNNWIYRGKMFLLMDTKHLPESKVDDIKKELKALNLKIKKYLDGI